MSQQNLISLEITAEKQARIASAIQVLKTDLLPHLTTLSIEDRKGLPKLGDKSIPMVQKVVEYCKSNPEFVPPFLDVTALTTDLNAVNTLDNILNPLQQIIDAVDDSRCLSGSEAYNAALMYYGSVKAAASQNIPAAKAVFSDLATRFPGKSKAVATPVQ